MFAIICKTRSGYALLLMLLMVVAIGMLLYYMDLSWMGGGLSLLAPEQQGPKPWDEVNKPPQAKRKFVSGALAALRPAITRKLTLEGPVLSDGRDRVHRPAAGGLQGI